MYLLRGYTFINPSTIAILRLCAEGRSWHGLHRHALMTMIAYAFLQHRRIATAARKKKSTAHRHSRVCRPCATPSSNSFFDHQISDAHTAEDKSAKCNGVNKSAKVVLGGATALYKYISPRNSRLNFRKKLAAPFSVKLTTPWQDDRRLSAAAHLFRFLPPVR